MGRNACECRVDLSCSLINGWPRAPSVVTPSLHHIIVPVVEKQSPSRLSASEKQEAIAGGAAEGNTLMDKGPVRKGTHEAAVVISPSTYVVFLRLVSHLDYYSRCLLIVRPCCRCILQCWCYNLPSQM